MQEWINSFIFNDLNKELSLQNDTILWVFCESQFIVNDINDLSKLDIFQDYTILKDPSQWNKTIQIKNKIWDYQVFVSFKSPISNNLNIVSKWHLQINIFNGEGKVWYLNSRLCPQSWRVKFSGMKKSIKNELWVAKTLLDIYISIAQRFFSNWWVIDYYSTTNQQKIDVAYALIKRWYIPNNFSNANKFSLYNDNQWKIYLYTNSRNKIKWCTRFDYQFLKDIPLNDKEYRFMEDVFIWSSVVYTLPKEKIHI